MSVNNAYRRLYDELISLFEYNPPETRQRDNPPPLHVPNLFYGGHLDSRLTLQRVEFLPSLTSRLAKNVIDELEKIKAAGMMLPLISANVEDCDFETKSEREYRDSLGTMTDAFDIAMLYSTVSWEHCAHVGSTLALHPRSKTWRSILSFRIAQRQEGSSSMRGGYAELHRDNETGKIAIPEPIMTALDEDARIYVGEMSKRFPKLITHQFYISSDEVHRIFRAMGNIAARHSFRPFESTVFGHFPLNQIYPVSPDGDPTLLALPLASVVRRSVRLQGMKAENLTRQGKQGKVIKRTSQVGGDITMKSLKKPKSDANKYIHHAWLQSVKDDTTFVVFNCGKYERIGVRHRASQTLYLSDIIDVHQCWKPAYGRIQIGLYLSVLKDAMDRIRQAIQLRTKGTARRKRKYSDGNEDDSRNKRHKTRSMEAQKKQANEAHEKNLEVVLRESNSRDLALLRLQFDVFNSPVPTALVRKGHAVIPGRSSSRGLKTIDISNLTRKYKHDEYFEVTITSSHAAGATGIVHRAILKIRLNDSTIHQSNAIVKIAVFPEQCKRLRHEYIVYGYMAKHGVTNIGVIYGLFEESESGACVLIMEDVGQSLYDREGRPEDGQVTVSAQEREAFERALSEIHKAGVRHYDIRPMNLMVNSEGKATIIDFDMAKIGAGQHSRDRECKQLQRLLRRTYRPPNQYPSPATTASSATSDEDIFEDL